MKNIIRYSVFLLGIFIFTLGSTLTLKANIGTGSYDAINFGLNITFGMSTGFFISLTSLIGLIIASVLNKEFIKITSFITSAVIGMFMDFWMGVLANFQVESILLKYVVFFIAILILCIGLGIYLLPELPPNPIDYLMVVVKDKFNLNIMKSKILIDGICIAGAIIFGGPIGIGTILATIMVGPGVNFFNDFFKGQYNKLIGNNQDCKSSI